MDTTLWGYLKKDEAAGMADVERMLASVRGVEGLFTLLWHQEAVRMKGGRLYWQLLGRFKELGCFVASGAGVASWWRQRRVPLVWDGGSVRLRGRPPAGLQLLVKTTGSETVTVEGGQLEATGRGYVASVASDGFSMKVD